MSARRSLYYYRTRSGREVDFVWRGEDGRLTLIQVAFQAPEGSDTLARELAALREALREQPESRALLVTMVDGRWPPGAGPAGRLGRDRTRFMALLKVTFTPIPDRTLGRPKRVVAYLPPRGIISAMYTRGLSNKLVAALTDTPVVLVNGARQSGKTTLVQETVADRPGAVYRTFDDAATLAAAVADPVGFVRQPAELLVVDEVQHVPALFPAIKLEVDRNRRPGRYLLTGSANVLLLPKLSESLAGRMEILTLEPLAQAEIANAMDNVPQRLFAGEGPAEMAWAGKERDLTDRVATGGYPEALARANPTRRAAWFGAYLTAILQRDVRDLANIEGLTEMPRLLSLLATRTAGLLNVAELSRDAGISHNTLKRYLALLQATFLIRLLPAWSRNSGKRFTKAPKLHLNDAGLACHLLGIDATRLAGHPSHWGRLVETFVVDELLRQATWSPFPVQASHFRLATGQEVDLVLEDGRGRVVGVEVKASATLRGQDLNGLKALAALSGDAWVGGVVFYGGDTPLPFGTGLQAWPIASLWTGKNP